ncbi:MAG: hypothetical protein M0Z71_01910 [Nitrospiraceae bacterium]|nr:hypothetical protein [Nitrospiraceae bacterium]
MNNRERWFFLFLVGTLLFNWPFLSIFSLSLPFYLFGLWAAFIIVISLFIRKTNNRGGHNV